MTGKKHAPAWSLIEKFEPKLDLVGFTTYPMFDYKTPAESPADYYAEIRKHTRKPIAITEMGWLSQEKFSGALAALNGTGYEGSEQEQVDFLARFGIDARLATGIRNVAVAARFEIGRGAVRVERIALQRRQAQTRVGGMARAGGNAVWEII